MKADHRAKREVGAIILAGGDGTRLLPLTRGITGRDLPNQFCTILGKETLLEQTRRRVSLSISPERTVTVLSRAHELFYSPLISETSLGNLAIQPAKRGTVAAILFGLLWLCNLQRISTVAIFLPSDRYLSDDAIFMRHVDVAISAVSSLPAKIVLLGTPADSPESGYGWIEPAEQLTQASPGVEPICRIRHFWEKPPPHIAADYWLSGFLRNSFVMVAKVGELLDLFARMTPQLYSSFAESMPDLDTPLEGNAIAKLYASIPSGTSLKRFSRVVRQSCWSFLPPALNGTTWASRAVR
jgi:mannose-1-phosphate guanylyltransferase